MSHIYPETEFSDEGSNVGSAPAASTVAADIDEVEELEFNERENKGKRNRDWCFTWNHYDIHYPGKTDEEIAEMFKIYFVNLGAVAWSREIGKKKKIPHLQGFIHFNEPVSFGTRTKRGNFRQGSLKGFDQRIRWCIMRGSLERNLQYCSKQSQLFCYPSRSAFPLEMGQGARNDLYSFARGVVSGEITRQQIEQERPEMLLRYERGLNTLLSLASCHREGRPQVIWMYGESGSGKNEFPVQIHGEDSIWVKNDGSVFFNGYKGEPVVVLNEFRPYSPICPRGYELPFLLQLFDKYRMYVEVKGGSIKFAADFIYVCSVQHPKFWYPDFGDLKQILRRLDAIFEVLPGKKLRLDEEYVKFYYSAEVAAAGAETKFEVPDFIAKRAAFVAERNAKREQERLEAIAMKSSRPSGDYLPAQKKDKYSDEDDDG